MTRVRKGIQSLFQHASGGPRIRWHAFLPMPSLDLGQLSMRSRGKPATDTCLSVTHCHMPVQMSLSDNGSLKTSTEERQRRFHEAVSHQQVADMHALNRMRYRVTLRRTSGGFYDVHREGCEHQWGWPRFARKYGFLFFSLQPSCTPWVCIYEHEHFYC